MSDLPDWTTIQTPAGNNLILDSLLKSSYVCQPTWTASNDNGVVAPAAPPNNLNNAGIWYGKFFPRIMKNAALTISIYCKGNGVDTLAVGITPFPGTAQEVTTFTITPTANWSWFNVGVGIAWPYDSICIYVKGVGANIQVGYDSTQPFDGVLTGNAFSSIYLWANRLYIRMLMYSTSQGDIPVSGTVTAVILPNETVKHGGLWAISDYSAKAGNSIQVTLPTYIAAGCGNGNQIDIVVPAGKSLYITHWEGNSNATNAADGEKNSIFWMALLDVTLLTTLAIGGGDAGFGMAFATPVIVPTGHTVRMVIVSASNHSTELQVSFGGYYN